MRAPLIIAVLVCVATLGAACTTTTDRPAPRVAALPPDPALPQPTPRPQAEPSKKPAPVPEPRPVELRHVEPINLDQLGGTTQSAVVALIGPPDEERDQPPGKIWIYRQGECEVEIHMYPSVDVGSMAVLGTAMRPATLGDGERERCRRQLARRTAKAG